MSFDYTTLITDRTAEDVAAVKTLLAKPMAMWTAEETAAFLAGMKGAYNATDLNRVSACMEDLVHRLSGLGVNVENYRRVEISRASSGGSRLPEGYSEVEYIQSSGTQYVDTGFKPNQDTRVTMDAQLLSTASYPSLFGTRVSDTKMFWLFWSTAMSNLCFGYGSNKPGVSCDLSDRAEVDADGNTLSVNGTEILEVTAATFTSAVTMYLFAANNNGTTQYPATMKCYSCQIYDDETLVRDYVPCINASNEAGLYDLVDEKFYGNSGSGVFFAGPRRVALPTGYTQLESITSSGTQFIDTGVPPTATLKTTIDLLPTSGATSEHPIFGSAWSVSGYFLMFYSGYLRWHSRGSSVDATGVDLTNRIAIGASPTELSVNGSSYALSGTGTDAANSIFLFYTGDNTTIYGKGQFTLYSCVISDGAELVRDFIPCLNESGEIGLYDLVEKSFYANAGTGVFAAGDAVEWGGAVSDSDTEELDPYTWYVSDVPTVSQMAQYLGNVASIRAALSLVTGTPATPESMEKLSYTRANEIEQILLAVEFIIKRIPTAIRHCGVAVCGGKGLIA